MDAKKSYGTVHAVVKNVLATMHISLRVLPSATIFVPCLVLNYS